MTSDEAAAEKAWIEYANAVRAAGLRLASHDTFNAGWRARGAEVAELREQLASKKRSNAHLADDYVSTERDRQSVMAERDALREQLASAEATLARVRAARSQHAACDKYPDDGGPVKCGWRRAVLDIDAALNGKGEGNE